VLSGTVLLIAMTPLLDGIFGLLLLFQLVRSWLEGVVQPVILSVQARAVGRGSGPAPDRSAAQLDPDPACHGCRLRSLGHRRELFHFRRIHPAVVRTAGADHPSQSGAPTRGPRPMSTT
jgi:hypothetical protein